jgi:Bacterial mobilisation protein (MobC)
MAVPKGQVLVAAYMPAELAARFKALANGRVSATMRELVAEATGEPVTWPAASRAKARQVQVRLTEDESAELLRVAAEAGMTPAGYINAVARAHLTRKPQWSPAELEALRGIAWELRKIGINVNQIAARLNASAEAAEFPRGEGRAAREAVRLARAELARLGPLCNARLSRLRVRTTEQAGNESGESGHA